MGAGNISELAYDYVNELSKANVWILLPTK
jgi:hypothetical protein